MELILVFIGCAIFSTFVYKIWRNEDSAAYDIHSEQDYCVMKGDLYCEHTEWCELEKEMFPEQYEEEMKKSKGEQK